MEKQKYYVNIQSQKIGEIRFSDNDFIVYATENEIQQLQSKLNNIKSAEVDTFWRAHVPFMPYHNDKSNDRYDKSLTESFQMIYDLGDEQARSYVTESGILSDRPIDTNS